MLRKKKRPAEAVQDTVLSDRLSFLDVIVETCRHSGRYTLIAESDDHTYTVLIDRGGPFNVDGGGLTGSAALVKASTLRHGTYDVIEGWPVDQPVYQLGLDTVLQGLVLGTKPQDRQLPAARGVDAIRNEAWQTAATAMPVAHELGPDPFATTPSNGAEPGPFGSSAGNGGALQPFVQAAGPWLVTETPVKSLDADRLRQPSPFTMYPPIKAPAQAVAAAPATPPGSIAQPPAAIPEPAAVVTPATVVPAADAADTVAFLREMARAAKVDPVSEPAAPIKPHGWIKRRVLRFLLWTVEVDDEPHHYTAGQVLILVGRSLGSGIALIFSPITRPVISSWHRVRADWRHSGEVTSRQSARRGTAKPKPAAKAGKLKR